MTLRFSATHWGRRVSRAGHPPDPRFSFANERTFLAWNRTALTLLAGGLAAAQLLHFGVGAARLLVGLALIALGAVCGVVGLVRWRASELALRLKKPLPRSRLAPLLLGGGAGLLAMLSVVALIVDQVQ